MCLFDCLRASGISCADLSRFIDEDWKISASNAAELIPMIEAGEQKFKERFLRFHEYDKELISAEAFFRVLKKQRDELIRELRITIEYNDPLWLSLEVVNEDHTADFIYEAVEKLDEIEFGRHSTPTSAKVIAFRTTVPEAETIDAEEGLAACNRLSETLIQVGAEDS
jgi:hypothetical protein